MSTNDAATREPRRGAGPASPPVASCPPRTPWMSKRRPPRGGLPRPDLPGSPASAGHARSARRLRRLGRRCDRYASALFLLRQAPLIWILGGIVVFFGVIAQRSWGTEIYGSDRHRGPLRRPHRSRLVRLAPADAVRRCGSAPRLGPRFSLRALLVRGPGCAAPASWSPGPASLPASLSTRSIRRVSASWAAGTAGTSVDARHSSPPRPGAAAEGLPERHGTCSDSM